MHRTLPLPYTLAAALILLLAAWTHAEVLSADRRFHVDEALFATYARGAAVYGDWALPGPLDKPPLSLYAMALSMQFVGVDADDSGVLHLDWRRGEFAARLPGFFAGLLTVALSMALAQRLTRSPSASLAAGLLSAASPFLSTHMATAFTDPLMLAFGLGAIYAAAANRLGAAGLLLGLSVAAKQQGILLLPLVLMLGSGKGWGRGLLTFSLTLAALLLWDAARPEPSLFAQAAANNDPQRAFIRADEVLPRLSAWWDTLRTAFGPPWLTLLLLLSVSLSLRRHPRLRPVALYAAGYFALHWLGPFNGYARYLLPLIPLLAVLIAGAVGRRGLLIAVAAALGVLSLMLSQPRGLPATDAGLPDLAAYVNAQPLGTIVYDPWLGWQMGYYVGPWSDKRRVYYPDPASLAADAPRNPDPAPRLFIAPQDAATGPWLAALRRAGFRARLSYDRAGFRAWTLWPP